MAMKSAFFLLFLMFVAFSTEIENNGTLLESVQPKDKEKLKQTPNLFPNETEFYDLEANDIWKDPKNVIPTENKKEIRFFLQNKGKESANRLFDSFYDWDVSPKAFPFLKKLFRPLSEYVEVERRVSLLNRTPLHLFCIFDAEKAVSRLIERGANLEAVDENGYTALHFAAQFGSLLSCKTLLNKKAKVNARTKYGQTSSLMLATRSASVEVVKILLAFDAYPNMKDNNNETALDFAPQNCADAIRAHIIKVDAIDESQCSSLHRAANLGNVIRCKLLLLQGANINHQDIYGVTPLMVAAVNGYGEVVTTFLQFDADTGIKDGKGKTAHEMATPSCAYFIANHEAKLKN